MFEKTLDTIAIWYYPFPSATFDYSSFSSVLSAEEREKAASYRYSKDAINYMFCRGVLRRLISYYTEVAPNEIQIAYTAFGKPYLINNNLKFNLSHTTDSVIFAFGYQTEIGIDLEKIEPFQESHEITKEVFSKEEQIHLKQLPKEDYFREFYKLWTRKEALLKALGCGFENFGLEILAKMQASDNEIHIENDYWQVQEVTCSKDHVTTLVYSGSKREIVYYTSEILNVHNP